MSNIHGKGFRGNRGGIIRGGEAKHNGFNNARVLPDDGQRAIYRKEAEQIIKSFLNSGCQNTTLSSMSREERKVMHEVAQHNGLVTRSAGKEPNRYVILSIREKKLTRSSLVVTEPINPYSEPLNALTSFLVQNPITKEQMDTFLIERKADNHSVKNMASRNKSGIPPMSACPKDLENAKKKLPASRYRADVLKSIKSSNVVIISGGTGCGKTTQVPQFILEEAHEKKKHVRIMVTQPRRIAAISISERVAKERGEKLGDTVGYQVRLESRRSDKTLLTYCTVGVLLRMLTSDPLASGITHIVMDEIHEREINTDYLLIALRECIKNRPDLKVILMSATIEGSMQLFSSYFDNDSVKVIRIDSRTYDVEIYYLDHILAMIGYQPAESQVFFPSIDFEPKNWEQELRVIKAEELQKKQLSMQAVTIECTSRSPSIQEMNKETPLSQKNDETVFNIETNTSVEWKSGSYSTADGQKIDEKTMRDFMKLIGSPDSPVTVHFPPGSGDSVVLNGSRDKDDSNRSPETLKLQPVQPTIKPFSLNKNGASPFISTFSAPLSASTNPESLNTPSTGLSKFGPEFGGFGERQRLSGLLEQKFRDELQTTLPNRTMYYHPEINKQIEQVDFKKLRLAEKYEMYYGVDFNNSIDHNLVDHVIHYLADSPVFGTILVFLPGYDDIQLMMAMIQKWKNRLTNMKHVTVLPLHSQMHNINHGDIFKPVNSDTRKIILATNIAEASITIEDVIFVVDTGKAKEKSYNHEAKLSTLAVTSIARSNAEQRSGRAGRVRNGYCFRLYSEDKFKSMPETQVAEMKRAAIYEVTLHAKLFAPSKMKIADFLALAPEPPEKASIIQSMAFLEQLGAFYTPVAMDTFDEDQEEIEEVKQEEDPELTNLGRIMAKLPLDPQLSRMLLFGLALKCLTPIVNLVSLLATKDPYLLAFSEEREKQSHKKHEIAQYDFSDHLMFIRLVSEFCSLHGNNPQIEFCREHYLNVTTMRMIEGTRRQLLQELIRANLISVQDRDIMTALNDPNFNQHSNSWAMVQSAIAAGCYPFVGVGAAESLLKKVQTFNDTAAGVHPSSMLKKQTAKLTKQMALGPCLEYVVFQEMCLMNSDKSLSMKTVTAITALTALLFTGPIRFNKQIIEEYRLVHEIDEEEIVPEEDVTGFSPNLSALNLDEWYSVKAGTQVQEN
uniref:Probable ATP-dependent RNA helicase spindle-E n=1 Tax=Caenorhabditis tropicalis TaxID=1561998 RepID=A0A1I7UL39_9PELO